MPRPSSLTIHPREMVLKILKRRKTPMSAYDILDRLAQHGVKGPPVVYRALEALIGQGLVHKVQATSEYLACNCAKDHQHSLSVLAVCANCKSVEELHDDGVIHHLEKLEKLNLSLAPHAVIELPVVCAQCS